VSTGRRLAGRQGAIVWAVSTFDAKAPFRVIHHDGSETPFASAAELGSAVIKREIGPEFDLAIGAKVRPVLLLQDRPVGRLQDYAALSLTRLQKFPADDQQRIRDGDEEMLFYLGHNKGKYGLDKEYAAHLGSLHRIHATAVVGGPLGAVDQAELRTICERLVRVSDLDVSNLIAREAAAFARRLGERGS
jgi:hypothetical protein